MSVVPKPGARLRSVTCATEVVVVKGAGDGRPPLRRRADGARRRRATGGPPAAPFDEGTLVGKRYVTEDEAARAALHEARAPGRSRSATPRCS